MKNLSLNTSPHTNVLGILATQSTQNNPQDHLEKSLRWSCKICWPHHYRHCYSKACAGMTLLALRTIKSDLEPVSIVFCFNSGVWTSVTVGHYAPASRLCIQYFFIQEQFHPGELYSAHSLLLTVANAGGCSNSWEPLNGACSWGGKRDSDERSAL